MRQSLNFILARRIKSAIWAGAKHVEIGAHFNVSSATVSRIQNGLAWADVPWPDGSIGAISTDQRAVILGLRYTGSHMPYTPNTPSPGHITAPGMIKLDPRDIEAEFDRIQSEEDAALMKKFLEPASPEERGPHVEYEEPVPMLDAEVWDKLLTKHPDNPFVQAAKTGTDNAKIAVIETFRNLPEEEWETDIVATYIKAALRTLERSKVEQG